MHSRSTCSIGCPKPRSTPSDKAATSSASRTFALVVGVAVAAVIFGTIRRPLHRDEAEVQSVGFATSTAQARAPWQFSSSGRGGGVRSSGAGSSCCSCRRPRSWRLGLPQVFVSPKFTPARALAQTTSQLERSPSRTIRRKDARAGEGPAAEPRLT